MTFKIGNEVIMTVDSGKGRVWKNLTNGEYKGKITNILTELIEITILGLDPPIMYFSFDGIAYPFSGMSIRPAEVDEYEVIGNIFENPGLKDLIIQKVEPTPSQWIEGQIPENEMGIYAIATYRGGYWSQEAFWKNSSSGRPDYTHYYKVGELPPPPPAKEVEAYGFLERCNQIADMFLGIPEEYGKLEDKARRFYSQLATAEVKEKYLALKTIKKCVWYSDPSLSLDQFINWYQKEYEKLLFTPAALKELGIKT